MECFIYFWNRSNHIRAYGQVCDETFRRIIAESLDAYDPDCEFHSGKQKFLFRFIINIMCRREDE